MRRAALVALLLLACVPATLPPQLAYTPGPPVVVTAAQYHTSAFSVRYPADWRAISSAAGAPPSVIFVAPDEAALIVVGVAPLDVPPLAGADQLREATITGDDVTLIAGLRAPADSWAHYESVFERVLESITPAPASPGQARDALSRPRSSPAR